MTAYSGSFSFSANIFPRAPDRQELLHIPLSLSLYPFDQNSNIIEKKLNVCPNCNSYLFFHEMKSQNSTPNFIKCPFCKASTQFVEYQPTPPFVEWNTSTETPPITLILIDSSYLSRSCGFFEEVLKNLPLSMPKEFTNFLLASFNSNLVFLTPQNQLLIFPDINEIEVPPSAFFKNPLKDATPLIRSPINHPIELIRILETSLKIVGNHGRVILFLSTPPVGFHPIQTQLELCQISSINFNPDWISLQKKYLSAYSRVDFLINLPSISSIDLIALKKFCDPMHSIFMIMDTSQYSQLSEMIKEIICSYVIFVKILFLNSLRSPGMTTTQISYLAKRKTINSLTFSMNSRWCKLVDFEMVSIGPKKLPFQVIINYRKLNGQAATRVYSTIVELSDDMGRVVNNLNENVIVKHVINQLLIALKSKKETNIKNLINVAIQEISPVLRGYRNHVSLHKPGMNEITLPNSLLNLPVLCLGALKSSVFSYGTLSTRRAFYLEQIEFASLAQLAEICAPAMLDVTDFLLNDAVQRSDAISEIKRFPVLSKLNLDPKRIFLMFDGFSTWIWIGSQIPQTLILSLFGVEEFYQIVEIQPMDNEASSRLFSLVRKSVTLCLENGVGHQSFLNKLVHDNSMGLPSYVEFLAMIQKSIIQGY